MLCFLAMCATLGVGPTPEAMVLFCQVEGVFYMAQWEEYHTGTLNWSNGYMGVTESQLIQMGLFVITACFGEKARAGCALLIPRASEKGSRSSYSCFYFHPWHRIWCAVVTTAAAAGGRARHHSSASVVRPNGFLRGSVVYVEQGPQQLVFPQCARLPSFFSPVVIPIVAAVEPRPTESSPLL